ncbi:MAG: chemotaxis-specific protein-glutamate methyltransferase CheB [Acidimicrobiales bacterium]|jgi:two-component system response regulator WspF|nr:chemotaxis-specific protein-glutamate methyltransferase CheB [Acidimicrobiales bacterium]
MRIAIVNDMRAASEALRRVVESLPDHSVAWTAADGVEAVAMARRDRPDLILMDLLMPHLDGAEASRQIMASTPCAILVVTATVSGNISLVYDAMGYGALDAVDTPTLGPVGEVADAGPLVEKIGIIAKLVGAPSPGPRGRPAMTPATPPRLLIAGASTGGPKALCDLLLPLPHDWNVAVVIVQHVDVAFAPGLATWLSDRTGRTVRVAVEGQTPRAGDVLLAGTNDHLVYTPRGTLEYQAEPREVFFRPSVDVFFESVAVHASRPGVAIVLTGMGKDGARGLGTLRRKGWHTLVQDEGTSVVWSMPKAALDAGAACEVLPVARMPAVIASRLG